MAAEPAYVSRVKIERLGGPQRLAYLPAENEPVAFGVHSEVAEHYGVSPDQYPPHATTLDYVVAAAGGWLAGTFAGALEARHIDVDPERYEVEAIGEVVLEDKVLVIRRITVHYRLAVPEDRREEAERVHGFHARFCPVARSLEGGIEVRTELELVWPSGRRRQRRLSGGPSPLAVNCRQCDDMPDDAETHERDRAPVGPRLSRGASLARFCSDAGRLRVQRPRKPVPAPQPR